MTNHDWDSVKMARAEVAPEFLEEYDRYVVLVDRVAELEAGPVTEPLIREQLRRLMQELTGTTTA